MYHINSLELLAGFLSVKCFTKSKAKAQVLSLMDNINYSSNVNKQNGRPSLPSFQTSQRPVVWDWCLNHNVLLRAQYLPGIQNVQADRESRVFLDSSDWKLNTTVFDHVYQK